MNRKINLISYLIITLLIVSCFNHKEIVNINNKAELRNLDSNNIVYKNLIYDKNIKTVLCYKKNKPLSRPIIQLNSKDIITVRFDLLDSQMKNYFYTIVHCDSEWKKSDLFESEYLVGFNNEPIINYKFSFNTIQKYTHYSFDFPNDNIRPTLSGNYIFKIFEEGKSSSPIIYQRFMVLDQLVTIDAKVRRATLSKDRDSKHEVDFTINTLDLVLKDPYSEIKVIVTQNHREDNIISDLKPIFIRNNKLVYDFEDLNTFNAENQYRYFDITSLRYHSERVKNITFDSINNHVYLFNDLKRTFKQYSIMPDINGKFLIKKQEAWEQNTESDYAYVHFTLASKKINYGDIFIIGGLSNWVLNKKFKMNYNYSSQEYKASIYLKQGYYNYMYALNDTIKKNIDVSYIEGSHFQTRNMYYIYVYYKEIGERFERLIGFNEFSSKELF